MRATIQPGAESQVQRGASFRPALKPPRIRSPAQGAVVAPASDIPPTNPAPPGSAFLLNNRRRQSR